MCGIAGIIGGDISPGARAARLKLMRDALARRGPDDTGEYADGTAALGHTRLSVIDPEHGRQPMTLKRGAAEYVLVYNGELYNASELRAELEARGHVFTERSDTEVLLHAYARWKDGCVKRLNGIFAFAVLEKHARRLFIARDRVGVKPFFYTLRGGAFIFASEIKGILANPDVPAEIDSESVAELMLLGPGRTPGCGVFRGLSELRPGYCGYVQNGIPNVRRYWSLADGVHPDDFEGTVEKTRALVIDAVRRQLVSDVPIGAFLSGGLDSSLISSIAADYMRERGERLITFSVDYRDNDRNFIAGAFQPEDDRAYVDRMTEYLGAENVRVLIDTEELEAALYEAVDARDLPGMADVDASLLLFCREIKKHVTVALSGECADEIFGGYPWYRDPEIRSRPGFPWARSGAERFRLVAPDFARRIDAFEYVNSRYLKTVSETSVRRGADAGERRMREMTALNLEWFMQTLLDRKDRMSMYSGLEVRVPFCDHRIAEYAYRAPWTMKEYGGAEKGLLREAARGLLPEDVRLRKKSPYPKTHNPAYAAAVSSKLREILRDPSAPLFAVARKEALRDLPTASSAAPWYGQLMAAPQTVAYFLQLNYWLKKYKVRVKD